MNKDETPYDGVNLTDEVILEEKLGSFPLKLINATPNQAKRI